MTTISVVATSPDRLAGLRAALADGVAADYLCLEELPHSKPNGIAILDIDLCRSSEVHAVKAWLSNQQQNGTAIFCIDDTSSHLQLTQARALGATAVVRRPLQTTRLRKILFGIDQSFADTPPHAAEDPSQDLNAIRDMFSAARMGQSPSMDVVAQAGAQIVDRLQNTGLSAYLSAIRNHHSRTYTHCLTVTAVAVSFGIQLGCGRNDRERLAVAGLLHDIGKSKVSIDILEKPLALDEQETLIMRTHAVLGHNMVLGTPGLPDDTLDMVLHHHEYLDGSGYPHGLLGSQISDLNRIMTIADVFGALIEPRSYKPPMPATQALDLLRTMGPKLDGTLVRVFAPLAHRLAA